MAVGLRRYRIFTLVLMSLSTILLLWTYGSYVHYSSHYEHYFTAPTSMDWDDWLSIITNILLLATYLYVVFGKKRIIPNKYLRALSILSLLALHSFINIYFLTYLVRNDAKKTIYRCIVSVFPCIIAWIYSMGFFTIFLATLIEVRWTYREWSLDPKVSDQLLPETDSQQQQQQQNQQEMDEVTLYHS